MKYVGPTTELRLAATAVLWRNTNNVTRTTAATRSTKCGIVNSNRNDTNKMIDFTLKV